ncbi:hypothetical protein [Aeromonas caviae]
MAVEPDGRRWLEVHSPLSRTEAEMAQGAPLVLSPEAEQFIAAPDIDSARVTALLEHKSGLPKPVSG